MTVVIRNPPENTSYSSISNLLKNSQDEIVGVNFFKKQVHISFKSDEIARKNLLIINSNSNIPLDIQVQNQKFKQYFILRLRPLNEQITLKDILDVIKLEEKQLKIVINEHENGQKQAELTFRSKNQFMNGKINLINGIKYIDMNSGRIRTDKPKIYVMPYNQPEKKLLQSITDMKSNSVQLYNFRRTGASQEVMLKRSLLFSRSKSGLISTPVTANRRNVLNESVIFQQEWNKNQQENNQIYNIIQRCKSAKK